jgi:hypothetical protein
MTMLSKATLFYINCGLYNNLSSFELNALL